MRRILGQFARALSHWLSTTVADSAIGPGTRVQAGAKVIGSTIANDVYIGPEVRLFSVHAGPYCSFGPRVVIGENEHEQKLFSTSDLLLDCIDRDSYEGGKRAVTEIGPDVWIGCNAFVRKGVRVGAGAIIGAHAVVVKDVPPFAIVAGVPARAIGKRFSDETCARLLQSQWWLRDKKKLQSALVQRFGMAETPRMRAEHEILEFIAALDTVSVDG